MNNRIELTSPIETPSTGLKESSTLDVKKVESSIDKGIQDRKVNDILNKIESEENESEYREKLSKLDSQSLEQFAKLDNTSLENLLQKPSVEIQKYLIQAQIKELKEKENLTKEDKKTRYLLKKKLIAVENNKQEQQEETIANENEKQRDMRETQNEEIKELRDALLNPKIKEILKSKSNPKFQEIEKKFAQIDSIINSGENLDTENKKIEFLREIKEYLKKPGNLESIAQDLGGVDSREYQEFKSSLIGVDESFRPIFNRVELGSVEGLAKVKLGIESLAGVEYLSTNTLMLKEDNLIIEATKDTRSLSLEGSDYKFESKRDSKNELAIEELNTQVNEKQKPLNNKLDELDGVLDFIKQAQTTGVDFNEFKNELKKQNPNLYTELGLENKNSFEEAIFTLNSKKQEIEKQKKEIIEKGNEKINQLVSQNAKELKEQDENKKQTLKFLSSIGFDNIKQSESNIVIEHINRYPTNYGLDKEIDFESGSIGFDKDRGNINISMQEKIAFVELFNKMLGEDIIKVDKELQKIIPLTIAEESRIQELSNKRAGFFISKLDK